MSKYWCKCGRVVNKSTNASTTGNRDTESCTGCLYLLPYGPNVFAQGGYKMDVQGYECRMTDHPVDYATHTSSAGGPNDKTVLHVESLDFDFLDTITEWVHDTFIEGELTGGFQRESLRASEFMDGYRVTFYPSQNKKGVAAKQQLFHRFFHPDGTRIDMTPEEEKAKVLADIEKSKEKKRRQSEGDCPFYAQRDYGDYQGGHFCHLCGSLKCKHRTCSAKYKDDWHECDVFKRYGGERRLAEMKREAKGEKMEKVYKDAKGVLYKVGETGEIGNADRTQLSILMLPTKPGATWRKKSLAPTFSLRCGKDAAQALDAMAEQNHWQLASEAKVQYNLTERAALLDDDSDEYGTSLYSLDLSERTIRCLERAGIDTVEELKDMSDEQIMRIRDMGRKGYDEIRAALGRKGITVTIPYTITPPSTDDLPWSAAATAVAYQTAEGPAPAALTPTTETAVSASEQVESAAAPVPALDDMPTFDYSGLSEQTVSVMHMAEQEILQARQTYICRASAAVAMVHEAVVANCENGENGKFTAHENTFLNWCRSVGLKKDAAYRLLQVDKLLTSSTPEEAAQLEQASPSLLYAAAKPSAPAELVQGVKDGDITTHKQYQEAMARIKQMEKDAELDRKERDDANAAAMRYKAEADRRAADQQRLEGLVATRERERDTAIQDAKRARKEQEESERLADDEIARVQRIADDATDRANTAEARVKELEGRPIEVTGANAADIARWRAEGAEQARQEVADTMAAMQEQLRYAASAKENEENTLYIMAQQIAANCIDLLESWRQSADGLEDDVYMDCVEQFLPLRSAVLSLLAEEEAEDDEMS